MLSEKGISAASEEQDRGSRADVASAPLKTHRTYSTDLELGWLARGEIRGHGDFGLVELRHGTAGFRRFDSGVEGFFGGVGNDGSQAQMAFGDFEAAFGLLERNSAFRV